MGSRLEAALHDVVRRTPITAYVDAERAVRVMEFGAVGASGALVNVLVLLALANGDGPLFVPGFVAFAAGVLWTYGLNRLVTFDPGGALLERVPHYAGVYAVGYVIYAVLLAVSVALALPYWLAGLAATSVGGLWNYWGSERFALR